MTRFILDSGDPIEYREISDLAKQQGAQIWGGTTNPSLIAKNLAGQKVSQEEAFSKLQKEIVLELTTLVPGAVSAEVYADNNTKAEQMIEQGREVAKWHERVVVKLPTNLEGLKARTVLRREGIPINNTLVFTQQQIFAINLHEQLIQKEKAIDNKWPPFISPFVGRLDDKGENGMDVIVHAIKQKETYGFTPLVLESSVRRVEHLKMGLELKVDLMTIPAKIYKEWFTMTLEQQTSLDLTTFQQFLQPISYWNPGELTKLASVDELIQAIESGKLDITHELTTKGIDRFTQDWQAIIA